MRLIMLGNGPYAVPTLHELVASRHDVVQVVARPPRGRRPQPGPVQQAAVELDLPLMLPDSVNDFAVCESLRGLEPDLFVVCDYGEILRPDTLAVPRLGGVNLHGSLLPRYRGAAPVVWAVFNGDQETGNTVIQMTPGLDAGPCLAQEKVAIDPDETAEQLEARLAISGATLVREAIEDLEHGTVVPVEQDLTLVSKAPRLKKSDGAIDWRRTATEIKNQVRAMQPWPKAFTYWHRETAVVRLILLRVENVDAAARFASASNGGGEFERAVQVAADAAPGVVVRAGERLLVAARVGILEILEVQPAGKRRMPVAEFLRGTSLDTGEILSSEAP